jgi:hypothetical protein
LLAAHIAEVTVLDAVLDLALVGDRLPDVPEPRPSSRYIVAVKPIAGTQSAGSTYISSVSTAKHPK